MMSTVSLILLGLALTVLCLGLLCLLYLLWDYYKEREWRRNNEDEWIYQEAERRGMNKRKSKR